MLCEYGCGQEAKYPLAKGRKKWCCGESPNSCPEVIRKRVEKMAGRTKETHSGVRSQAEKMTGRTKENNKGRRSQAEYMNSCITDDSKPENELFYISCKILPRPIHKYPIYRGKGKRNYTVDISDSSLGIILEFDGHYHFNTKEAIGRDKRRQQEIEGEGWKFLRYNIFQKFPTLEQVKEDILNLIKI
mgnify:CR=1 FL=1